MNSPRNRKHKQPLMMEKKSINRVKVFEPEVEKFDEFMITQQSYSNQKVDLGF
jgi:hypothetical protein